MATVEELIQAELLDPEEHPEVAQAAMAATTNVSEHDTVIAEEPPDTGMTLAGGLRVEAGYVVKEASVRELTGADEETLAKDSSTQNFGRYISTLLRCGVEEIGGEPATVTMLKSLLIGDRDLLVMHIRRVTYGDDIEMDVKCPNCDHEMHIKYTLTVDVPIRELDADPDDYHRVELRNGRWAEVRLPTGADQEAVLAAGAKKTLPEQNTILLGRIVASVMGETVDPRALSAGDRAKILDWITETMPGPQYDKVKMDCSNCDQEFPIRLGVVDLFRL